MDGVNPARGEARAMLGGRARRLCLTLRALAELEGAFGVEGVEGLAARLRRLSAGDVRVVLAALLRGGGEPEDALDSASFREAAEAVAAAFAAAAA